VRKPSAISGVQIDRQGISAARGASRRAIDGNIQARRTGVAPGRRHFDSPSGRFAFGPVE